MDSTVQASLGFAVAKPARPRQPAAVASLADRVLKTMLLTKLSLFISPVMAAGTAATDRAGLVALWLPDHATPDAEPGRARMTWPAGSSTRPAPAWRTRRCGPSSVRGANGAPIATAKTDGQGRFVLPEAWDHDAAKAAIAAGHLGLFARAPDGRIGWLAKVDRSAAGDERTHWRSPSSPVGEVRGRVTDQNGRPIEGAEVTPLMISRVGNTGTDDSFNLTPS